MKMLLLIFYFLNIVYGSPPYREAILPHCSHNSIMEGRIESSTDDGKASNVTGSIQFHMSLHETACIRLEVNDTLPGHVGTSSILHSVEFLRLEHHYGITGKYKFGIPSISVDCKCDCAGGDSICSLNDYHYKNCSSSAPLCYRTYKPFQSNIGCFSSGQSDLCCQMSVRPYNDWIFQAIKIRQPSTILVLRYRIFERLVPGWSKSVDKIVEVPLNRGVATYELNTEHNIEIIAGGSKPHRQLESGVYFWRIGDTDHPKPLLHGGVAINEVRESSLEKLGWFRMENNAWTIRNGLVKMTQAQHVQIQDCKAQRYLATLNAEQLVFEGSDEKVLNFNLGSSIEADPWVSGVEIGSRSLKIDHAEGTSLLLTLKASTQPRAVHHISQFTSFNGSIQLDKDSNRFLNLTFTDTRGTLIVQVFPSESRASIEMDIVFSVQTSDTVAPHFRAIVALPASIESRRYVCIHASGDLDSQQCQWLEYKSEPLNEYRVAHRWQTGHSECSGCNERGVDSFLVNLDPRRWFDGLNSPTEIIMCVFEFALAILVLILTIALCTKCIIPLSRWLLCITKVPKK